MGRQKAREPGVFVAMTFREDLLQAEFFAEETTADGKTIEHAGVIVLGDTPDDLCKSLYEFRALVEKAILFAEDLRAQTAEGAKVVSNTGTTSTAPGDGAT